MTNADHITAIKQLAHALMEEVESLLAEAQGPSPAEAGGEEQGFYQMIEAYEKFLIRRALAMTRGQQAGAARLLRLKPTTLHNKIKTYKIKAGTEPPRCDTGGRAEVCVQGAP